MKRLLIHLVIIMFPITCFSQKVYVKTVDSKQYNDSLTNAIDSFSDFRITIHFSSYWNSKKDTFDVLPDLHWNSTSHIYSDRGKYYYRFVSPYIVTHPKRYEYNAVDYFWLNDSAIFATNFRPNETDYIKSDFDSAFYRVMKSKGVSEDTARELAQPLQIPARECYDCPSIIIEISQGNKKVKISFSNSLEFNSKDEYYIFNSELKIYTFYLLLKEEHERFAEEAGYRLEQSDTAILSYEERLEWLLYNIPLKIKDYEQWEREVKNELRQLRE